MAIVSVSLNSKIKSLKYLYLEYTMAHRCICMVVGALQVDAYGISKKCHD